MKTVELWEKSSAWPCGLIQEKGEKRMKQHLNMVWVCNHDPHTEGSHEGTTFPLLNNPHPKAKLPNANTRFTPQNSLKQRMKGGNSTPWSQSGFFWKVPNPTSFSNITQSRGGVQWHRIDLRLSPVKLPPQQHQFHKKQKQQERLERFSWVGHLAFEESQPQPGAGAFRNRAVWGVINGGSF